jgi:hypothetical protein
MVHAARNHWRDARVVRDGGMVAAKIRGATAIPMGRYSVRISFSPKFQCELPEVLSVPNFTGIRIHPGNTAADTEGCVLVGRARGLDVILESRLAFVPLLKKIREALHTGPVNLIVLNVRADA